MDTKKIETSILLEQSGIAESSFYSDLRRILRRFVKTKTPLGYFIGHFHLVKSYVESLENGSPPPVKPEEGKKTIKLLECIEQSLNTHKIVTVK